MTTNSMQKNLVVIFKKETILNLVLLNKIHPLERVNKEIFKENSIEKLTQNLFNHLCYYLVSIIDSQVICNLPWPIYDTEAEKKFRKGLADFINIYSLKRFLSPVISSYLVNPNCYKVTLLIYQMSLLALHKILWSKMSKGSQKKLYKDVVQSFKSRNKFRESIEKDTTIVSQKFSEYMFKREKLIKTAEMMCNRITAMEAKISGMEAQRYINNLIDGYFTTQNVDVAFKKDILDIKNVFSPSQFFNNWLLEVDEKISQLETEWNTRIASFLTLSSTTQHYTERLMDRVTGQAQKSSYTLEYNPEMFDICTTKLEHQVNSEQKYILKNIIKNNQLSFPNLIRGYLIAISFIQKNSEDSDEIYKFNEYLDGARWKYSELVTSLRDVLDRITAVDGKLKFNQNKPRSARNIVPLPILPDLSELKMGKDLHTQIICDNFTPINITKHHFNLRRKSDMVFTKPQSKSHLITPFYQGPSIDFLKSLMSCRKNSGDYRNLTQNLNISTISKTCYRMNETIASSSSGFTKDQIMRLLSTKKSSSSKKLNYKTERPNGTKIKKGDLFNESQHTPTDSNVLYRSYSSPNLSENRERKSRMVRQFTEIKKNSPLLEVSGILMLDKDISSTTIECNIENSKRHISSPHIIITPKTDTVNVVEEKSPTFITDINLLKVCDTILHKEELKTETPVNNTKLMKKTNSLEKIINRFKKVRASVVPSMEKDFKHIVEGKENVSTFNIDETKRVLLPDLLSPSYSIISKKSMEESDSKCFDDGELLARKPRESLGTALGVDHTFLDQFDLSN